MMTSRDKDRDILDEFMEFIGGLKDVKDKNQDLIDKFKSDGGKKVNLTDSEPLTDIHKTKESIAIETEMTGVGGPNEMSFRYNDKTGELKVSGSKDSVVFILPDDVDIDKMEASINNGVLSMEIPRVSREVDVEVSVVDERDDEEVEE